MPAHPLRVALAHLAPIPGDLARNRQLVEEAVAAAARAGADWIVTPELIIPGYTFADRIGTEWILPQPDALMMRMGRLAARLHMTMFLSHPEQDPLSNRLYNTVFVMSPDGSLARGPVPVKRRCRCAFIRWATLGFLSVPTRSRRELREA